MLKGMKNKNKAGKGVMNTGVESRKVMISYKRVREVLRELYINT